MLGRAQGNGLSRVQLISRPSPIFAEDSEDLRFSAHDSASSTTELEFQIRLASALQATSGRAAEPTYKADVARAICAMSLEMPRIYLLRYTGSGFPIRLEGNREAPKAGESFPASAEQRGDRKAER